MFIRRALVAGLAAGSAGACRLQHRAMTAGDDGDSGDSGSDSNSSSSAGDIRIDVITHAAPGDSFWDVVKAGAEQAGDDLGVDLHYNSDPDPGEQSTLIDNAVADGTDGLVVSMANPDGLEDSIKAAVAAGVPVITINSGIDDWQDFGAITHVGQSETIAGEAAGEQLNEAGAHQRDLRHPGGRQRRRSRSAAGRPRRRSTATWRTCRPTTPTCRVRRRRSSRKLRPTTASTASSRSVATCPVRPSQAVEAVGHRHPDRHLRPERRRGAERASTASCCSPSTSSRTSRATWASPAST